MAYNCFTPFLMFQKHFIVVFHCFSEHPQQRCILDPFNSFKSWQVFNWRFFLFFYHVFNFWKHWLHVCVWNHLVTNQNHTKLDPYLSFYIVPTFNVVLNIFYGTGNNCLPLFNFWIACCKIRDKHVTFIIHLMKVVLWTVGIM